MRSLLALLLLLTLGAAARDSAPERALNDWLTAFNAPDRAVLERFAATRMTDPSTAYMLDMREESGGLDLVQIVTSEPTRLVAMTRERHSGLPSRVTVELERAGSGRLASLAIRPLPVAQEAALAAMDDFAERLAAADRFSGVIAIALNGRPIYQRAFGLANRETGERATLDTRYFFESQGKMFTAVAVLQLVEAGRIALDAPLGTYLTDYSNAETARVTVRQLLMHTGGTGDMGIMMPEESANRARYRTIDQIVALNANRPPAFPPGSRFDYSNHGFLLLGAIIQRVTGQDYYDYVAEHVLRPAGMVHTSWPTMDELPRLEGIGIPYRSVDGQYRRALDVMPWRGTPAGGGITTAGDETRFIEALRSGRLISPATVAEATRPQTDWYGYGFVAGGLDPNFPAWGHGGMGAGSNLALTFTRHDGITFVCMANRSANVCDRLVYNWAFHQTPEPAARR
ncbi:MAG TPA: serine hydrolase domain-containing protein [Allosphingosinicella sp.]|jgi:CubicO group peptidase (beta-lactamase class C family)